MGGPSGPSRSLAGLPLGPSTRIESGLLGIPIGRRGNVRVQVLALPLAVTPLALALTVLVLPLATSRPCTLSSLHARIAATTTTSLLTVATSLNRIGSPVKN